MNRVSFERVTWERGRVGLGAHNLKARFPKLLDWESSECSPMFESTGRFPRCFMKPSQTRHPQRAAAYMNWCDL